MIRNRYPNLAPVTSRHRGFAFHKQQPQPSYDPTRLRLHPASSINPSGDGRIKYLAAETRDQLGLLSITDTDSLRQDRRVKVARLDFKFFDYIPHKTSPLEDQAFADVYRETEAEAACFTGRKTIKLYDAHGDTAVEAIAEAASRDETNLDVLRQINLICRTSLLLIDRYTQTDFE